MHLKNDVPINLNVRTGVGNSDLALQGLNLTGLTVDNGVGNTTINLSGSRLSNLYATINGGTGNITSILLKEVGVKVKATNGLEKIISTNLNVNGQTYTIGVYGQGDPTIEIQLKVGIGNITLT